MRIIISLTLMAVAIRGSIVVKISLVSRYLQMQIGVRPLLILQNQR